MTNLKRNFNKNISLIFLSFCIFTFQLTASAQTYEKIADDTIGYMKAGTFGKPDVAKKTNKIALAHVRVHFKFITTQAVETRDNSAKVSVYLDGAMTNGDLQKLTDGFYATLQRKLSALGISFADWSQIQGMEYYTERQKSSGENKRTDGDAKNGQAWVSYTAFDGPVFNRFNLINGASGELFSYGKMKDLSKMSEQLGAELMLVDAVVDFSSINLQTSVGTVWNEDGKFKSYDANQNITAIINIPQSYVVFFNHKGGFDQYNSKQPVAITYNYANKLYKDENKAALKTRTFFGDTRFTFTPVVVDANRELYIAAARRALEQYADIFVEKMRLIRGGTKPSDNKQIANNSDNTTLKDVKETAKKNNDTTPITTGEITAAAKQAEKERKFQLAVDYYGELIKLNPDDYNWYLQRGVLLLNELKNAKDAIKDFTKAMELNSDNLILPFNRGTAYIQTSDWKKAKADFDKVISLQPDYVNAYLNRGIVFLNMKKNDEALADFNKGIQLNPRYSNLYRARALAYKMKGENNLAQADELRAAQLEQR